MSVDNTKCLVRVGKHASAADFTTEPAGYTQADGGAHMLLESHNFRAVRRTPLTRGPDHPQNMGVPAYAGPIDISGEYTPEVKLCGLSGNNGGAIDPALTTDVTPFFDCLFGTASIDPAGAATTAVNAGSDGATKTLAVTELARTPVGMVIAFQAPLGTWHFRQVRARSAANGAGTVTLDRTFVGAVANLTTIIRSARWKDDPAVMEHVHMGFDVEWPGTLGTSGVRRKFIGGMGKWMLDFSRGRSATLKASLKFTDIQAADVAGTAFTAPTRGSSVIRTNNKLWIGDENFIATDVTIEEGGECNPYNCDDGPHGVLGFTKHKGGGQPRTTMKATFFRGARTGEVPESTGTFTALVALALSKNLGEEMPVFDLLMQAGGAAGGTFVGVMRAGQMVSVEEVVVENKRGFKCEFAATGYDADIAPFEAHLL